MRGKTGSFAVCVFKTKSNISGKGVGRVSNGDGKRRGVRRGGQVSSSLSIYLRVFHSCTIRTNTILLSFHLSFDSPHGQTIVAAGV